METLELAQNYFGNTREGSLAGPVGAFLIGALAVTTVLLIRNMNARLRRLPARFDGRGGDAHGDADSEAHRGQGAQAVEAGETRTVDGALGGTSQNG